MYYILIVVNLLCVSGAFCGQTRRQKHVGSLKDYNEINYFIL